MSLIVSTILVLGAAANIGDRLPWAWVTKLTATTGRHDGRSFRNGTCHFLVHAGRSWEAERTLPRATGFHHVRWGLL